jgi:adenosylhomocysteine nucleosidase
VTGEIHIGSVGAGNFGPGPMHVEYASAGPQTVYHGTGPAPGPAPGAAAGAPAADSAPGMPAADSAPGMSAADAVPGPRADVGVLTVLSVEMRAVVDVLRRGGGYRTAAVPGGAQVHEAQFGTPDGPLRVVAAQTLDPGPRSAALGYVQLRQRYAPPVVLLVGIAGGIGAAVAVGDVVIADQVIYYDARKETGAGPVRRGQSQPMAAELRHRLHHFLLDGPQLPVGPGATVRVHCGPVGSGDAVLADAGADLRRYLRTFHDKTLAVETEAAGLAQAFYEEVDTDGSLRGWLTIRGIADLADAGKDDGGHEPAARNAAAVLERLLPFLKLPPETAAGRVGSAAE